MSARLWFKLRWKVIASFGVVALILGVGSILYAWNLSCPSSLDEAQCSRFLARDGYESAATFLLAVLPLALALVLSVGATAGEIQGGTTVFAWSVAPSRNRWLVEHLAWGIMTVVGVALCCGILNTIIIAKLSPGHDLTQSYIGYGLWGPILVIRAICVYALGVLVGLILRRTVPSLVLCAFLVAVAIPSALVIGRSFQPAEVLASDSSRGDALGVSQVVKTSDGTYESWSDCANRAPSDLTGSDLVNWRADNCLMVPTFLPGSSMTLVEGRESLVLLVIGFSSLAASGLLIGSRRP